MLRSSIKTYWPLIFTIFVFAALLIWSEERISSNFAKCISDWSDYEAKTKPNQDRLIIAKIIGHTLCIVRSVDRHNGLFTAIASILVAGFTYTLYIATSRLATESADQIKLAREEFIFAHRPKLVVRQFTFELFDTGKPIKAHISILNVGSSDAIPEHISCEIALWNGKSFDSQVDFVLKPFDYPPIAAGQRVQYFQDSKFELSDTQRRKIGNGDLSVQILGEITYTDSGDRKIQRRTGFRRRYDVASNKFIASPDPDEEYCD